MAPLTWCKDIENACKGLVCIKIMNIKLGFVFQEINPLRSSHEEILKGEVLSSKVYLQKSYI